MILFRLIINLTVKILFYSNTTEKYIIILLDGHQNYKGRNKMPDMPQGFKDPSLSSISQAQQDLAAESSHAEAPPAPVAAKMTMPDGTKVQKTFLQNPESIPDKGVRGSGLKERLPELMAIPNATIEGFSATLSSSQSREADFVQDQLQVRITKEGDAKELLMQDAQEGLFEDTKEKLSKDAHEIIGGS